jgi:hypothetical protein
MTATKTVEAPVSYAGAFEFDAELVDLEDKYDVSITRQVDDAFMPGENWMVKVGGFSRFFGSYPSEEDVLYVLELRKAIANGQPVVARHWPDFTAAGAGEGGFVPGIYGTDGGGLGWRDYYNASK